MTSSSYTPGAIVIVPLVSHHERKLIDGSLDRLEIIWNSQLPVGRRYQSSRRRPSSRVLCVSYRLRWRISDHASGK